MCYVWLAYTGVSMSLKARFTTHVVQNLPDPLLKYDAWAADQPLREAVQREGGAWADAHLAAHGVRVGDQMVAWGEQANRNRPTLRSFDRYGRRITLLVITAALVVLIRQGT